MIRSSIGIVCVLVLLTTCAQSTAAQWHGDYSLSTLRGRVLQSHLDRWIELADQGISDQILSTDAYHDEFRFRAAPVKQSRNWKMPLVHVRPAKDISTDLPQPHETATRVSKTLPTRGTNGDPVLDWVWESPSDLVVRYSDLDDPFGHLPLDFIPRPLPPQVKRSTVKHSKVKRLELKLAKVTPTNKETAEQNRPVKEISNALGQSLKSAMPENEAQRIRCTNGAPVLNWVWESSSDLAVRYSDLDDPFGQVSLDFIPRPLPPRVKHSQVERLELILTKVTPAKKETVKDEAVGQDRAMTTSRKDYWTYYSDCDRWNVVFAIPTTPKKADTNDSQQVVDADGKDQRKSELAVGFQELAALIAQRWENTVSFCRKISNRFLISGS